MDSTTEFVQMLDHLCNHRDMYVCGGTFYEVCAYLTGYASASADCPLSNEGWKAFNHFVCASFRFPPKYAWPYVLNSCFTDDDVATERLRQLLTDFCNRTRDSSYDEIIEEVTRNAGNEGEPEQTLRRLLSALLVGSKQEIEPLIQQHADAEILWEGSYPPDVACQLEQISRSSPIGRLPETRNDDDEVRLITADFPFPVTLKRIDGRWKVDITQIVEVRKRTREQDAQ